MRMQVKGARVAGLRAMENVRAKRGSMYKYAFLFAAVYAFAGGACYAAFLCYSRALLWWWPYKVVCLKSDAQIWFNFSEVVPPRSQRQPQVMIAHCGWCMMRRVVGVQQGCSEV
ncbi:hypothetical protein NPIL_6881 [Nephila pilipes]|uniref:Uncharacterized protein n=1 Tax=Nephila pilipes TaxID=299642 RepID=A0A8X6TVX9_NEPPI|nr:hypothetical protein NPIL_6881 [Nephila pilipes]